MDNALFFCYPMAIMATLLNCDKLAKAYGPRVIFNNVTFAVNEKQKIGLIGRNGAGKSTLLRIILGQDQPDSGTIHIHDITRLGYLEQHEKINLNQTALDFLIEQTGQPNWQCAKIAGKFELKPEHLNQTISDLSGGYRMRLKLTVMLLKEPNLFLLDEPTNYLDVHTQILLEKFLQNYNGAFIIISHDREFLKRTCEQTLEIEHGGIISYPRPIDEYLEYKKSRLVFAKSFNKKIEREEKHLQSFVDRFRYKATKAKQAQSKMKAIEKLQMDKIDINDPLATVQIQIPGVEDRKGIILHAKKLAIGYSEKTVVENINLVIDRKEKVAVIGDNGQGKTTFFKTLADALPAIGGSFQWAPNTKIGYYAQHVPTELDPLENVWHYLRRTAPLEIYDEEVNRMAGNFLFDKNELEKTIGILSGGEKARLCLAGLLLSKSEVLLLDEPTNHLDFETVEALGRALKNFVGTVIFISHNRTFINSLATLILEIKDGQVRRHVGTFEDYIYYLKNYINQNAAETSTDEADTAPSLAFKPNDEIKKIKRELRKTEEEITELEKTRKKWSKKQEKNPTKFSVEDYKTLGDIIKQIEQKEEKWLKIQERLTVKQ